MAGGVRAAVQCAARIVIFDLEMVAARLAKIDRVRKVRALRFSDFAEAIFVFVSLDVFPRGFDFFMGADAKAVVVVEGFLRRIGPALVHDQAPIRVRMFERCFAGFSFDDFHGQELGENRQRVVE